MYESDRVTCCGLLLFVSGAVGVAGIVSLLTATHHTRAQMVGVYRESARLWTAQTRRPFADAEFVLNLTTVGGTNIAVNLDRTHAPESHRPAGNDIPLYMPLRYTTDHELLYSWAEPHIRFQLQASAPFHEGTQCASEILGGAGGLPLAYHLDSPWSHGGALCASRHRGSFDAARSVCVTYHALTRLCIKVALRDGCWSPDASGGGYGCEPGADGLWALGTYESVAGNHADGAEAFHRDPPTRAPPPNLLVRHAGDPLIAARNLTAGSLDFGLGDGMCVLALLSSPFGFVSGRCGS